MSQTYHILNGDALLDFFPENILSGEIIIARECLVDGPLGGETKEEFWKTRAAFISEEYNEESALYFTDVVPEFSKIISIPEGSEVNLWFEEDLFCQVNLWFCLSLLAEISGTLKINLVKPPLLNESPDWRGFGALDRDELAKAYQDRQRLSGEEIQLLADLWNAYKNDDREVLQKLSHVSALNFPFLPEVVKAQLERFSPDNLSGRPETVLKEILRADDKKDFQTIFKEFSRRQGIYGFGDWQVESLLNKLPEYHAD